MVSCYRTLFPLFWSLFLQCVSETCVAFGYMRSEKLAPPKRTRITNRGPLFEGEAVELECVSTGSRPPAEVVWRLEHEILTDAYIFVSPDENSTTAAVSFTPRREHDGKVLLCESFNPLLENSSSFEEWTVSVYYKPEVKLTLLSFCEKQHRTHAVHLRCEANAKPRVTRITWRLNGTVVDFQRPTRHGDKQWVSAAGLKTNFTGSFECSAENSEGRTVSDALLLPRCSQATQLTSFALLGLCLVWSMTSS
ncbi:cell adhesion molecule 2-like [Ornithodoros turicata]|uniref:cell adhesion molecule 2-like n=1 Tax=Ornithodoros turicata TaxID=34597 RepID=UPI003139DBC7